MASVRGTPALLVMSGFMSLGLSIAEDEVVSILTNGDFETGQFAPWFGGPQPAVLEIVDELKPSEARDQDKFLEEDPIEGEWCLHIVVGEASADGWSTGAIHQSGLAFEKGKVYTLAACCISANAMRVHFRPELAEQPFTGYGAETLTISNEWREYHVTTPEIPDPVTPAEITFWVAFDEGDLWMDAIQFYEGEYVPSGLGPQAVQAQGKLNITWAEIRARD